MSPETPSQPPPSASTLLHTLLPSHPSLRRTLLPRLLHALHEISLSLRQQSQISLTNTSNSFGDDQLNVDVSAEASIRKALAACPCVVTASSEEDPVERTSSSSSSSSEKKDETGERYTVAFDPLDGSSIIGANWTVGTIIGIWDADTAIGQDPRTKQIVSILGLYGPRASAIIAIRLPGQPGLLFELSIPTSLPSDLYLETFTVTQQSIKFLPPPFKTRYFAPANLRAAAEDEKYAALITRLITEKYTLRYSGGLVPDVVHALVKGHGVYVSPVTGGSKAKLRRLYELMPLALVVECAGGEALELGTTNESGQKGGRILDRVLGGLDERGGIVCGTKGDVEDAKRALEG